MRTPLLLAALFAVPAASLAQTHCPIQRLEPQDGYGGAFGMPMAIDSGRLLIRDSEASGPCPGGGTAPGCVNGAIYSFTLEDGLWTNRQLIYPLDMGVYRGFGNFDVEGDLMIATTANRDSDSRNGLGHVYRFDHTSGQWFEADRFPAPDAPYKPTGGFGNDVALRGDSVLISRDSVVFLYQQIGESWKLAQTIDQRDATIPSVGFGLPLAMNDDWAFIGAMLDQSDGYYGAIHVYRRDASGQLVFHEKLRPPLLDAGFGRSMALDGSTLAVWGGGTHVAGSVFVYDVTADGPVLHQDVTLEGVTEEPIGLGIGVSLSGDTMVCGSYTGRSWMPGETVGYVFKRGADGLWRLATMVDPEPAAPYGLFRTTGHATATDGEMVVISHVGERPGPALTGAAYSFDLDCEICQPDLDLDGALTIFDFLTFMNLFQDGDARADFDGDGDLTLFDFLAFQTAFDAGC